MPVASDILVQKEYEKNPDIKPADIQHIRDWLTEQAHLPTKYITDFDLILAYHCCECAVELTKVVIDLNYTLRALFAFYQNRRVDESLKTALDTWLITPLQTTTVKGHRAIYCQILDSDPDKFNYGDVVRAFVMIMDLWLSEEGTSPGTVLIVNMDNVSLGHLSRIDLTIAQQFFYFLQQIDCYTMFVRLKEFHFINASSFMDTLMTIVRPFMKKELLDMLRVHPVGSATLEDFIPMAALPKEAGGQNKEGWRIRDDIWNKLNSNVKFFEEESKKRVDESKRLGGSKTMSSFFTGLEGSFKRLEID